MEKKYLDGIICVICDCGFPYKIPEGEGEYHCQNCEKMLFSNDGKNNLFVDGVAYAWGGQQFINMKTGGGTFTLHGSQIPNSKLQSEDTKASNTENVKKGDK